MPYNSTNDLPNAVKKLDSDKQRQWMNVFNSAYNKCEKDGGKDCDAKAARQAWGAVKEHVQESVFILDIVNESVLPNGNYKISGEAIHPVKTFHPQEWGTLRSYIEPYLIKSAPSLAGAPLVIDHQPESLPSANRVTKSWWDSEKAAVMFEGEITPEVHQMFASGELTTKVSIGADYLQPGGGFLVGPDGEYIFYGYDFYELSLISKGRQPGDPYTTIQVWESLINETKVFENKIKGGESMEEKKPITTEEVQAIVDEAIKNLKEGLSTEGNDLDMEKVKEDIAKLIDDKLQEKDLEEEKAELKETLKAYPEDVVESYAKLIDEGKDAEGKEVKLSEIKEALATYMTIEQMKELKDDAYALVVAEEGKEKVSLYPHHDKEGKLHKDSILRSLESVVKLKPEEGKLSKEQIDSMKTHLTNHCKDEGWESEVAGITKETMIVDLRKALSEEKDKVSEFEIKLQEAIDKRKADIQVISEKLDGIIPLPIVTMSHRPASGFTRLVENVKRVKREIVDMQD